MGEGEGREELREKEATIKGSEGRKVPPAVVV